MRLLAILVAASAALAQDLTWREIAPLVHKHCNACHRAGQVGPFDFTTYEGASAYAPEIARYVLGNKMPPWRAKASPLPFSNSRDLPDAVIAQLMSWANNGAKPGTPLPLPKRHPLWNLGAPGIVLQQPKEDTISAEKTVAIVSFDVPPEELGNTKTPLYFNALEFRPTNRNVLHHAVLKVQGKPIAAWAMCDTGIRLPAGVAWHVPANTPLTVELHYFKRNFRTATNLTRIALYPAAKPRRIASLLEITKPDIRIPAGANLHPETTIFSVPANVQLHAVLPVFQLLANQIRLRQAGQSDYFLWVQPFEHHVMTSYILARPLVLTKGSRLEADAIYDNSTQNEYNPHKTLREVRFAENGLDETFRFWLTVSQ